MPYRGCWNVRKRGGDFKDERLDLFTSRHVITEEYGLMLFQELFSVLHWRVPAIYKQWESAGYHIATVPFGGPVRNFLRTGSVRLVDAGLAIVSKKPIVERDAITFGTRAAGGDLVAAKGCLYALIYPNGPDRPGLHVLQECFVSFRHGSFRLRDVKLVDGSPIPALSRFFQLLLQNLRKIANRG